MGIFFREKDSFYILECILIAVSEFLLAKTTSGFGNLLEGLGKLNIQSYSQLRFITAKKYKAKSLKGKGRWNEFQRKPGTHFQEDSLSGVTYDVLNSPRVVTTCVKYCLPGKPIRDSFSGFLLGIGYVGTFCQQVTNSRLPEKKQVFNINHSLHKQFRHCEPFLSGNGWNSTKN